MFASFNARALGLTLSLDESIQLASEHGFGGIDIMIRDVLEQDLELSGLTRKLDDVGLLPGAFPLPIDWRTTEEVQFFKQLEQLRSCAEAAQCVGLTRTATWVMPETPQRSGSNPVSWDETFEFHIDRLGRVARILDAFGIAIGLEVIGVKLSRPGLGIPFIHRLDQINPLRRAIEASASVRVGILIDSWHLYAAEEPLIHALAWDVEEITWVHIADLPAGAPKDPGQMIDIVRGLPGENGTIDSRSLLKELNTRGYRGPVTAEPLARCDSLQGRTPGEIAKQTMESLRSVWPAVS